MAAEFEEAAEAEAAMDDGGRAGGRGGDGDDGGEAGATAEEAATVVNGRIDGGFGPDMAAAVAMNGLTVRELLTLLRLVCFGRARAPACLCRAPLLVVGFCKDFCLWRERCRSKSIMWTWGSVEFDDFHSRRQRKSFRSDTK